MPLSLWRNLTHSKELWRKSDKLPTVRLWWNLWKSDFHKKASWLNWAICGSQTATRLGETLVFFKSWYFGTPDQKAMIQGANEVKRLGQEQLFLEKHDAVTAIPSAVNPTGTASPVVTAPIRIRNAPAAIAIAQNRAEEEVVFAVF